MSDLEVPESAYEAAAKAACIDLTIYSSAPIDAAINAAAPLIVAAELRRIVREKEDDICWCDKCIIERADELDPEGLTT